MRSTRPAAAPASRSTRARRSAALEAIASDCDLLLCMSVNPGWGGQSFIAASLAKVEAMRALRARRP